ncbi:MAG: lipopolysaccharide biosynthesis protein [Odoribacter sp.]
MEKSYTKTYIKIYIFQFISVLLGIVSLFIVTPYLSGNKFLFGIYSICVSLTIYFSYADLGFMTAGQKFAAECYAKDDRKSEYEIISFTGFILLIFMAVVSFVILLFAYNPHWLIAGLTKQSDVNTARWLLVILAFSSPIIAFQRILGIIYSVRMEDYKYQRILIIGNVMKILSVLVFFTNGRYMIVSYYLFFQIITLCVTVGAFVYAVLNYGYDIKNFIKNIKFNKSIFEKLKGLAFVSLFSMFCWILYYELDQIVIAKLMGPEMVSIYAIAFSVLALFRTFLGVIYTPFTARFNHFIGVGDQVGLNRFFLFTTRVLLPLSVFPILIIALLAKPFLYSWVGVQYEQAISLTSILVFSNLFAFFSYPSQALITAKLCNRTLYLASAINVVVFWGGVILFFSHIGLYAFAVMKVCAFCLSTFFYFFIIGRMIQFSYFQYIGGIIRRCFIPVIGCVILCILIEPYMFLEKSVLALLYNLTFMGIIFIVSFILCIITFPEIRNYLLKLKNLNFR